MKRFLLVLLCIVLVLLFAWIIAPFETRLETYKDRPLQQSYFLEDCRELKAAIEDKTELDDSIISIVDDYVKSKLEFGYRNDVQNGKANCVGYSQLWANTFNYLTRNLKEQPKAKTVVGIAYLYIGERRINLNQCLMDIVPEKHRNFVMNHDYVELEYRQTKYYFSPSMEDVFGCFTTSNIFKIKTLQEQIDELR